MNKLNRASVVSYIAELFKTVGDKRTVSNKDFTDAVCHICDLEFFEHSGTWYMEADGVVSVIGVSEKSAKEAANELKPSLKGCNSFWNVATFAKWDLVHQKLKELNKAVA